MDSRILLLLLVYAVLLVASEPVPDVTLSPESALDTPTATKTPVPSPPAAATSLPDHGTQCRLTEYQGDDPSDQGRIATGVS